MLPTSNDPHIVAPESALYALSVAQINVKQLNKILYNCQSNSNDVFHSEREHHSKQILGHSNIIFIIQETLKNLLKITYSNEIKMILKKFSNDLEDSHILHV